MDASIAVLLKAASFSANKHRGQRRKGSDASPYINHPLDVANTLAGIGGVAEVAVLAAAILHDTLEDTCTTPEELESEFGPVVTALVQEVTDDKTLPKAERKQRQVDHAADLSSDAKLIKLGDKISNVREVIQNPPVGWSLQRRHEYLAWAMRVVDGCRGTNLPLERCFDELIQVGREVLEPVGHDRQVPKRRR
ncbi:MAG: HD domain-containing protein [Candidatus Polarisedimenticolia bacterium]